MTAIAISAGSTTAPSPGMTAPKRLLALDVMRGLTIAFMIMVNNPGGPGAWKQMTHAEWNGFTATDLVFPTFLFIVGISIVFAVESKLARGISRASLARHACLRAIMLFGLGIVVNGFPEFNLEHLRFYGVLQRIAVCYLIVCLFYLWNRRISSKVIALVIILLGYWALVRIVPVPGAGVPGRDVPFLDRDLNIVAWVDRQLMPGHLYEDGASHNARDPEGLLSDLPAMGTTLIGLLVGMGLRADCNAKTKVSAFIAGAAVALVLGYLWSLWFPLNKKMWTSSYVLVAAGWSLAIWALFYWLLEVLGWFRDGWSKIAVWPWLVFGSNAITAYVLSELLGSTFELIRIPLGQDGANPMAWTYHRFFLHIHDPGWRAFAFSAAYTLLCFLPVWVLYRKRIFLKV